MSRAIDEKAKGKEEAGGRRPALVHGDPPYYAYFEHPDGSWYMLWMTHTIPKTARGHPWHVHATYDKHGATRPDLNSPWHEQPYGMRNWDFDTLADAIDYFYKQRYLLRIKHGYYLKAGKIPRDWPVEPENWG